MNSVGWAWPPWPGSITASSLAPLPPGPTPSVCRSSARRRCSTRSPNSQRTGSRGSPRRSPTAGSIYADFLLGAGHSRIAVAAEPSVYWASGARILREYLAPRGGTVIELDLRALAPAAVCDELAGSRATALLLLAGYPEPAVSVVRSVRRDRRLAEVMIGAPAGQPEFAEWATLLGDDGAAIPFLRYRPERLSPLGARVETALRARLAEAPSFVAFEGYDTVAVLADVLRSAGQDRARIAGSWPSRCRRRHPRADPVLPPAGHQRLAMGLGARPGRRPGSGRARPLSSPPCVR